MVPNLFSLPAFPDLLRDGEPESEDFSIDSLNIYSNYMSTVDFRQYNSDGFSLFSHNIRSLSSNFDDLVSLINSVKNLRDILLLTESWVTEVTCDLLNLPGYNSFHIYRNGKKGGGVTFFTNDSLNCEQIKDLSYINKDIELNTIKISNSNTDIYVFGVYRPPSGNIKKFLTYLENHLEKFKNKRIIFSGDLNIDLMKINTDNNAFDLFNLFCSSGLFPTITRATRFNDNNPNKSSLIDQTWTNLNNYLDSHILISDITDHFPSVTYFENFGAPKKANYNMEEYRNKPNSANTVNFLSKLENRNFEFVNNPNISNVQKFEQFDSLFYKCYDEEFPIKKRRV